MNIQINGNNVEISQKVKNMVQKRLSDKLDQLLPNYNEEIKTAFLHLIKDKYGKYKVKFDMSLPGKEGQIFAENQNDTLLAAITGLREQIEKQIKKYKQDKVNYSLG